MDNVRVELGERGYDIVVGDGAIDLLGEKMTGLGLTDRAFIITNPTVNALYGERARASLDNARIKTEVFELPDGEQYKQLSSISAVYDYMIEANYTRATTVVALGGGVVGDMAGFVASSYMRGVRFVQVPTTLLAMVDSSVGGKTGVNHRMAKNMIGAFYQPQLVLADLGALATLPDIEFRAGYAETFKYGVIWDEAMFDELERDREKVFALEPEALGKAVVRSCEIKAEVVAEDEREGGLRAILNYGHTFAHGLEAITDYTMYKHGEAVSIGMVAAARTSVALGMIEQPDADRIERCLADAGLPVRFPAVDIDALLARFSKDKKVLAGTVRFILPTRIGEVILRDDVEMSLVREVVSNMMAP